ncbi:MAG: methionine--tRNA ligase, partial [candidate division WOR-3 bacterium]
IKVTEAEILYKKIEQERITIGVQKDKEPQEAIKEEGSMNFVTFEEFKKLEIRIGEIISVEDVPGADKIYKLEVNLGNRVVSLVAGMKTSYKKEELLHKKVPVLVNLEPKKLRGIESNGMVLACDLDGKPVLLVPEKDVPPGSIVK